AADLIVQYASDASNQFVLYGNIHDRFVLPLDKPELGSLTDFLLRVLLPRFDVILSYDLGNGIRVEKGQQIFADWPTAKESELPKSPRAAIETLTHYFRYCANLARLNRQRLQVGCFIKSAQLVAPNLMGGINFDIAAVALLMRDWNLDSMLAEHSLATFLITESLNDLHPLLVNNNRTVRIPIPLPTADDLSTALKLVGPQYPTALSHYAQDYSVPGGQLVGATLTSIEALLRTKEYNKQPLTGDDLVKLKKTLVESDCNGLIEFIESKKSLDDIYGQEKVKAHLRQDFALWNANDTAAMPMGYLLAGPVGTGKTFMVECLAGEAGVPVVKFKNFRDKWVGSTEANLEKIFRILHALGRCFVFVDEADQALGKRDAESGDSGVSGRVYSMFAEEMSNTANRGKVLWILASSRPDLIEVDLKRPGRVDVKIPLFPTTTVGESYKLIQMLAKRRGLILPGDPPAELLNSLPLLLTPGSAEALAVKLYRQVQTTTPRPDPLTVLRAIMADYQSPVPLEVMQFQIELAVKEASDLDFVPAMFRPKKSQ
ncbi:MAG: ATP-binding protein, partial [Phycisphaerae bacterium]